MFRFFAAIRLGKLPTICHEGDDDESRISVVGKAPMNVNETTDVTDRELVLGYQPTARVESRPHRRTGRDQHRVVCTPAGDQRADLGPWCGTEDRAWAAACLRLGLRLHRS